MRFTRPKRIDPLDQPILRWSKYDPFTVRELLNGGVCITGRSGSGKTSSSGKLLGNSIIGLPGSGGLILAAKPEDLPMWQRMFKAAGRESDLIEFSPQSDRRFNFLGHVLAMGGHTRDVTRCITVIGETLRSADSSGGESAEFWEREQNRMIYNAVEIIRLATGTVSAPDIQRFINTAATTPDMLLSPEWQAKYCNQCMEKAHNRRKNSIESHDYALALDYWLNEFPSMADKTRSSILTGVLGILHVFNVGVVRELVSTTTNVSPDDMLQGKWVIVNMAPAEWGDMGALVAAGWKFLTQRQVLRRHVTEADGINVIWADEYHQFVNSYDAHYLAQCRSHKGCMVVLSQSLPSYYASMKGSAGKNQTDALLTNFSIKIMHALGDVRTAEWAAGLIGRELRTFIGATMPPISNAYDELMGFNQVTTSTSQQYESVLQQNEFMNGLRCGGEPDGLICDAYVIRSGKAFSNGNNWLRVGFSQKG